MGPLNFFKNFVTHHRCVFYTALVCFSYRQNEGPPPVRPSSAGELPPLERAGSPTSAEKDILVCYLSGQWRSFRKILFMMIWKLKAEFCTLLGAEQYLVYTIIILHNISSSCTCTWVLYILKRNFHWYIFNSFFALCVLLGESFCRKDSYCFLEKREKNSTCKNVAMAL